MPDQLRDLSAALRRLHRQAGEPSTRTISRAVGYSHTTVAQALNGSRCPSWPLLEKVVIYLGGTPAEFLRRWIDVRNAETPLPDLPPAESSADLSQRDDGETLGAEIPYERSINIEDPDVVLRWRTTEGTYEFFSERLALQWIILQSQQEQEPPGAHDD
jgi:hypothetical protein